MGSKLRERLKKQAEDLKRRGPGKFISFKEGLTRIRVLPAGEEKDFALEVVYFYLGLKDNMAIISPATFGKKCAVMKAYTALAESKDAGDRERAAKFKPGRRFFIPVYKYKDEKGKEVDYDLGVKPAIVPGGLYQDMIEMYLDSDNGDFTDPKDGYDLKVKRTGKGKNDTEYTLLAGPKGVPLDKKYRGKTYDIVEMVKEITPTYEETKLIIEQYLNLPPEDGDDDKSSKNRDKKKRRRDI